MARLQTRRTPADVQSSAMSIVQLLMVGAIAGFAMTSVALFYFRRRAASDQPLLG